MCNKLLQSCLPLCDPMDCSPPGSSVRGDSLGKSAGVGSPALPQGIFPTQGSNLHVLCLRTGSQVLYCWPTWEARKKVHKWPVGL